jgi:hypothetical protein
MVSMLGEKKVLYQQIDHHCHPADILGPFYTFRDRRWRSAVRGRCHVMARGRQNGSWLTRLAG